jgi:8-oxo-dGTP pyrophosphatase MutT (NUDIX family)
MSSQEALRQKLLSSFHQSGIITSNKITFVNVNKYGDTLLRFEENDPTTAVQNYFKSIGGYDATKGYILHFMGYSIGFDYTDFKYITMHQRSADEIKIIVYANEAVTKKCPKIINNQVSGSSIVLNVGVDNSDVIYSVFVKDRTKTYITNPAGTLEFGESHLDCAIRECREETGLTIDLGESNQIGSFTYNYNLFELPFTGQAKIYMAYKNITQSEFNNLLKYECDEIEKVYVIPMESLIHMTKVELNNIPLSSHHLLAARYVAIAQLDSMIVFDWKSLVPDYLKDFELH